jgi:branched-chain amino acid transport system ATP-binding protein
MLEVLDIHAYRGANYVLQGVSLQARPAACTTLLGRNGMGKTTLIRCLMGLTSIARGVVTFEARRLNGLEPNRVAKAGLGLVPQGRHVFRSLTVEENLTLAARVASHGDGRVPWSLERIYELFPNLKNRRTALAGKLSGGEQQMLAIGRALMTNPRLLLMDEPSEGLAPVMVERVHEIIQSLTAQSLSIFLVEQNYRLGVLAADHVYILSKGAVVWHGTPTDLEKSDDVKQSYLGV